MFSVMNAHFRPQENKEENTQTFAKFDSEISKLAGERAALRRQVAELQGNVQAAEQRHSDDKVAAAAQMRKLREVVIAQDELEERRADFARMEEQVAVTLRAAREQKKRLDFLSTLAMSQDAGAGAPPARAPGSEPPRSPIASEMHEAAREQGALQQMAAQLREAQVRPAPSLPTALKRGG